MFNCWHKHHTLLETRFNYIDSHISFHPCSISGKHVFLPFGCLRKMCKFYFYKKLITQNIIRGIIVIKVCNYFSLRLSNCKLKTYYIWISIQIFSNWSWMNKNVIYIWKCKWQKINLVKLDLLNIKPWLRTSITVFLMYSW